MKRMLSRQTGILLIILSLFSCQQDTTQTVLDAFPQNTESHKAASFLLSNLQKQYATTGEGYRAYIDTIAKYAEDVKTMEMRLKEMRGKSHFNYQKDVDCAGADYFIENIKLAIEIWHNSPWKKQVCFSDFCEYVLPYCVNHEGLTDWRKTIFEQVKDSVNQCKTLREAGEFMIKKISAHKKKFKILFGTNALGLPDLPWSSLEKLNIGSCKELSDMTVMWLRGAGVPCAVDYTPLYANYYVGHSWNALIVDSLTSIPFKMPTKDTLGYFMQEYYVLSKVYRKTWSVNKASHSEQRGYCSFLPSSFNNPCQLDVTDRYVKTGTVSFDLPGDSSTKQQFAYLCTFDFKNWTPVSWGKIKDNKLTAANIAKGIVYLPVTIDSVGRDYLDAPFLFGGDDNPCTFYRANHDSLITLNLLRKYPLMHRIESFIRRMVGGEFQGANKADFSDATTLYHIAESPGANFNEIAVDTHKKFRYFRYRGGVKSSCNIAELEVYGNNDPLHAMSGKIIGTKGSYGNNKNRNKEKVFDGDPTTFFDAIKLDSCWVGLDFGKPTKIDKFRFIARTDYNIIAKGNEYELMYWENGWQSLGVKIADSEVLRYENVPSGAVYLLHNHTAGKEERIFTYENGKQLWW